MTSFAQLTFKIPRYRIAVLKAAILMISLFIRSEKTGQRVGDALLAWACRGLRVYAGGETT